MEAVVTEEIIARQGAELRHPWVENKNEVHPAEAYLGRRCRPKGGCAVGFSEA